MAPGSVDGGASDAGGYEADEHDVGGVEAQDLQSGPVQQVLIMYEHRIRPIFERFAVASISGGGIAKTGFRRGPSSNKLSIALNPHTGFFTLYY